MEELSVNELRYLKALIGIYETATETRFGDMEELIKVEDIKKKIERIICHSLRDI